MNNDRFKEKFKEIFKLKKMLDEENIEYEFYTRGEGILGRYQIACPNNNFGQRYISVIEGFRNIRI